MKKRIPILLLALLVLMLLIALSGCGLWSTPLKSISFGVTELNIKVGEEVQLHPTPVPSTAEASIEYSSNNAAVASISRSGLLKGVSGGVATITASNKLGNVKSDLTVNVTYSEIPEGALSLSAENSQQYFGSDIKDVDFTLSWGDTHVPQNAQIKWFQKTKSQSEFTEITEAAGLKTFKIKPIDELGFSATVYVTVTYEDKTYTSNEKTYGVYDEMRNVRISYGSNDTGIFVESGTNYAYLGENFTLTLSWDENSNQDPDIKWFIEMDGEPRREIAGQKTAKLSHAVVPQNGDTSADAIGDYTITASADGVLNSASYNFYFSTEYADVKNATLTAQGYSGNIEITPTEADDIVVTAGWNRNCTDNSKVVIEYYVAPLKTGEEFDFSLAHTVNANAADLKYTYTPTGVAGEYALKTVIYNEVGSLIKVEAVLLITILDRYNEVDHLNLAVSSGTLNQSGGVFSNVVFSATPTPSTCLNPSAQYIWYVNGAVQSGQNGSTFTLTSSYLSQNNGETAVEVELAGVKSKIVTATAFVNASVYTQFLNKTFLWNGSTYNQFISSMDELVIAMSNMMMQRIPRLEFYFDTSEFTFSNDTQLKSYIQQAKDGGYDESGGGSFSYNATATNTAEIGWNSDTPIAPTGAYPTTLNPPQITLPVHYTSALRSSLFIDSQDTYNVTSSNMLYRVVSWGYKPTFNAVAGESAAMTAARVNAQQIYENAREILLEICHNDMTETEKAHAIFDWIVTEVDYDYDLSDASGITVDQALAYNGFYLEGIFLDNAELRAVCDGKSKAFALMCGMEGISACRVIGYVENNQDKGHAWNKVLLDPDGDGIKHWYIVDTTWSDFSIAGKEYAKHNYFLRSDAEIYYHATNNPTGTHTETRDYYPKANDASFNFFESLSFTVNASMLDGEYKDGLFIKTKTISNSADCLVSSREELAVLLAMSQIYGYVEFALDGSVTDYGTSFFEDAILMLVNEGGNWMSYNTPDGSFFYTYQA